MALLPNMTMLQALSSAGFTQFANVKGIYLLRTTNGQQTKTPFNYKDVVKGNHPEQNIMLKPGDTNSGPVRKSMRKRDGIGLLVVLLVALSAAWAQDSSAQQPADAPSGNPQQPVPAFGPDNPAPPVNDNPPISGVDMPNLEPHAAPLSYLQAGAHVSEFLDSNVGEHVGGIGLSLGLAAVGQVWSWQRLWSHYDLALDYLGGVGYYGAHGVGLKQIEELGVNQKNHLETRAVGPSRRFQLPA